MNGFSLLTRALDDAFPVKARYAGLFDDEDGGQPREPAGSSKGGQFAPKSGITKPGVEGIQQSLFNTEPSGQGQLFNVAAPAKKGKARAKGRISDDSLKQLTAGLDKRMREFLSKKETVSPADRHTILQDAPLEGQRDLFARYEKRRRPKAGDTSPFKWITIGGHPDGGKRHKGGSPVKVGPGGKIVAGPDHLEGKTLDQISQGPSGDELKQQGVSAKRGDRPDTVRFPGLTDAINHWWQQHVGGTPAPTDKDLKDRGLKAVKHDQPGKVRLVGLKDALNQWFQEHRPVPTGPTPVSDLRPGDQIAWPYPFGPGQGAPLTITNIEPKSGGESLLTLEGWGNPLTMSAKDASTLDRVGRQPQKKEPAAGDPESQPSPATAEKPSQESPGFDTRAYPLPDRPFGQQEQEPEQDPDQEREPDEQSPETDLGDSREQLPEGVKREDGILVDQDGDPVDEQGNKLQEAGDRNPTPSLFDDSQQTAEESEEPTGTPGVNPEFDFKAAFAGARPGDALIDQIWDKVQSGQDWAGPQGIFEQAVNLANKHGLIKSREDVAYLAEHAKDRESGANALNDLQKKNAEPNNSEGAGQSTGQSTPPPKLDPPAQQQLPGASEPLQHAEQKSDGRIVGAAQMHYSDLKVDPERFQYKVSGVAADGVTDELRDVKQFNPMLGGQLLVWRDPADGNTYVVNGHHRHELASRSGEHANWDGKMSVYFVDAQDAQEARAHGALTNIAEGRGTSIDAAKFLRDSGLTPDELEKEHGISLKGRVARDGVALTNLSDDLFQKLSQEEINEGRALAIANHLPDHDKQKDLLQLIKKNENKTGKALSDSVVAEMARELDVTPVTRSEQGGLFGAMEMPLIAERAHLKSLLRRSITGDRNAFKQASSSKRQGVLESTGENKIDVEANREAAQQADVLLWDFDKRVNRSGDALARAVSNAAEQWSNARTGRERKNIETDLQRTVRGLLETHPGTKEEPRP